MHYYLYKINANIYNRKLALKQTIKINYFFSIKWREFKINGKTEILFSAKFKLSRQKH